MSLPTGFVHAHIQANPSRVGVAVSRSDLAKPGVATSVLEARLGNKYSYVQLRTLVLRLFCQEKSCAERE